MAPKSSVALDQWRGLAMALVLVSHSFYASDRVNGIGRIGIQLFFVISGVLVYRSLARKRERPWPLLALDFWWRRFRRLYPALLAYTVLMLPVTILLERFAPAAYRLDPVRFARAVPSALVYAIDYWPPDPPRSLGHLWSVACEMQFFLVAPLIFFLGNRYVWAVLLAALMVAGILAPVVDPMGVDKYHFEYAAWPLMLGFCCEARRERLRSVSWRIARAALAGSLLLFGIGVLLPLVGPQTKTLAVACGSCVVVACVIAYVRGLEISGHEGRSLEWLGQRTYSVYLWQQPLTLCSYLPAPPPARRCAVDPGRRRLVPSLRAAFPDAAAPARDRRARRACARRCRGVLGLPDGWSRTSLGDLLHAGEGVWTVRPGRPDAHRVSINEGAQALSPDGRLVASVGAGGTVVRT